MPLSNLGEEFLKALGLRCNTIKQCLTALLLAVTMQTKTQGPWGGLSALYLTVAGVADFLGRWPRLVWFAPLALERRRT
jgi:hypothetical protein